MPSLLCHPLPLKPGVGPLPKGPRAPLPVAMQGQGSMRRRATPRPTSGSLGCPDTQQPGARPMQKAPICILVTGEWMSPCSATRAWGGVGRREGGRKEGGLPALGCTDTPRSTCLLGCERGALRGGSAASPRAQPAPRGQAFGSGLLQRVGKRGRGVEPGWAAAAGTQKGRRPSCGNCPVPPLSSPFASFLAALINPGVCSEGAMRAAWASPRAGLNLNDAVGNNQR